MLPVSIVKQKKEKPKRERRSKLPKTPRFYNGSVPKNETIQRDYKHFQKASEIKDG